MKHFYRNVRGLGNVAVSRHAQARLDEEGISQETFDKALLEPTEPDVYDGLDVFWRERDGVRIVVLLKPTPNHGAVVVKTAFRVECKASSVSSQR